MAETASVEKFLNRVNESGKFSFLGNTVENLIASTDSSSYIVIRPTNSDDFQIEVTKTIEDSDVTYAMQGAIITNDKDEFDTKIIIKNERQVSIFINMMADSLKNYSHFRKYAKLLEDLVKE